MAKILINCLDHVDESMAGPAIRSWEFASLLAKKHTVTLMAPNKSLLKPVGFVLRQFSPKAFKEAMIEADFIISQSAKPKIAKLARKHNTRIILDAYDPITIEALETFAQSPTRLRVAMNKALLLEQSSSFAFADSVICASEKQRDFWFGVLSSMNKLTPDMYDHDNSFRHLIDVAPFGLSSKQPKSSDKQFIRHKFGLSNKDFVLLWGGGIWNWFDPISLIEAINIVKDEIPAKLVFMGIDHPNKNIPRTQMTENAIQKAQELGLENSSVFFNQGWVPYAERQQFLLGADAGVSMHFDHLETRFSFRTRMLDYIWAKLPIIATEGDSFASLVEERKLGCVVGYQDPKSIAAAIRTLATQKTEYSQMQTNLGAIQEDFYWEKCVEPIERMIDFWEKQAPHSTNAINPTLLALTSMYGAKKIVLKKLIKKSLRIKSN